MWRRLLCMTWCLMVTGTLAAQTSRTAVDRPARSSRALQPADVPAFLDWLEITLRDRWAYYRLHEAEVSGAIDILRRKVRQGIPFETFAVELRKVLAPGGDGHSAVLLDHAGPEEYLPFGLDAAGERLVASRLDRSSLLDPACPYLARLDGLDVAAWMAAAAAFVPQGSPQYVRSHSLEYLRNLALLRQQKGLPARPWAEVELTSADGSTRRAMSVLLNRTRADRRPWPQKGSRILDGGIGYLRLTSMSDRGTREIRDWMPRFRDTRGLVIDVRDNGGGQRHALQLMFSYLSTPADAPRIGAVAAYRLHAEADPGMMSGRYLYTERADAWDAQEREAIQAFKREFRPQWTLPAGAFSEWHYMVLRHRSEPGVFSYRQPAIILMNERCFSATDVFLAGLKGWRNVTLVGTPSGGGSGAPRTYYYAGTLAGVRISSMASFQPDGRLFDGNGVQPDIDVEPAPEFFTGGRDLCLEKALELIRSGSRPQAN